MAGLHQHHDRREQRGHDDFEQRGNRETDDAAAVASASPVLDIDSAARRAPGAARIALRLLGIDALQVARSAPDLLPRLAGAGPSAPADLLAADALYLNAAARVRLGVRDGDVVELQSAAGWQRLRVAGSVAAGGAPLAVLDLATMKPTVAGGSSERDVLDFVKKFVK